MPLHPIGRPKGASRSTVLTPGSVVEYEQHGKVILAVCVSERKGKWSVLNEAGQTLDIAPDRLFLLPEKSPYSPNSVQQQSTFLKSLAQEALALGEKVSLEEMWELFLGEKKEIDPFDVAELINPKTGNLEVSAARRALLRDAVYFKRKNVTFECRSREVVEELKRQVAVENKKRAEREALISVLIDHLKGDTRAPLPPLGMLEDFAAFGGQAEQAKEAAEVVRDVIDRSGVNLSGKIEEKAFDLLVKIGQFHEDQDLNLLRMRRPIRFTDAEIRQSEDAMKVPDPSKKRRALSGMQLITIDSETTRDIDDGLSLERTPEGWRVGIHISDVAAAIGVDAPLDRATIFRASSIYTPDYQVPMLPSVLSEGALSLVEGQPRNAVSFYISFDEKFAITGRTVERTLLTVSRRMSYDEVDELLYGDGKQSDPEQQLCEGLWNITCARERERATKGAIQFNRRELAATIDEYGKITIAETQEDTPARKLVAEMMILANETGALFAKQHGAALIFRSQEAPEVNISEVGLHVADGPAREYLKRGAMKRSVQSTEPLSHYGLGVDAYAQATSPIRRAQDLINQRQLVSIIESGKPQYAAEQLNELMAILDVSTDEISQVQRSRNRYWLQKYLQQENITEVWGTIVRVDQPKPLAEIEIIYSNFPFFAAPDRETSSRLGERVKLSIEENNPRKERFILKEVKA